MLAKPCRPLLARSIQVILVAVRAPSEYDADGDDARRVLLHGNTLLEDYVEHAVTSSKAQPSRAQNVQRSLAPMLAKMLKSAASGALEDSETKEARDAQLRQALQSDTTFTPTSPEGAGGGNDEVQGAGGSTGEVPEGLLTRTHESAIRARVVVRYRTSQQKGQRDRLGERQAARFEGGATEDESAYGVHREGANGVSSESDGPTEGGPNNATEGGPNNATSSTADGGKDLDKPHRTASVDIAVPLFCSLVLSSAS
jgi:hypothetical protein